MTDDELAHIEDIANVAGVAANMAGTEIGSWSNDIVRKLIAALRAAREERDRAFRDGVGAAASFVDGMDKSTWVDRYHDQPTTLAEDIRALSLGRTP